MLDVHIHRRSFFRRGYGPAGLNRIGTRVKGDNFVFVFDVVIDHSLAVGHGIFRTPAHRNCGDHLVRGRVDHRRIVGFPVHGENVLRRGLVNNAVWIAARLDVSCNLERFDVKNDNFISPAIADKSLP